MPQPRTVYARRKDTGEADWFRSHRVDEHPELFTRLPAPTDQTPAPVEVADYHIDTEE